jgi:methionyl-tRNA synthetase
LDALLADLARANDQVHTNSQEHQDETSPAWQAILQKGLVRHKNYSIYFSTSRQILLRLT